MDVWSESRVNHYFFRGGRFDTYAPQLRLGLTWTASVIWNSSLTGSQSTALFQEPRGSNVGRPLLPHPVSTLEARTTDFWAGKGPTRQGKKWWTSFRSQRQSTLRATPSFKHWKSSNLSEDPRAGSFGRLCSHPAAGRSACGCPGR